jgi:hypothetical protein
MTTPAGLTDMQCLAIWDEADRTTPIDGESAIFAAVRAAYAAGASAQVPSLWQTCSCCTKYITGIAYCANCYALHAPFVVAQPSAQDQVDKMANPQGSPVDKSAELQGDVCGDESGPLRCTKPQGHTDAHFHAPFNWRNYQSGEVASATRKDAGTDEASPPSALTASTSPDPHADLLRRLRTWQNIHLVRNSISR